jgi:predicted transcriptional regulator with HTH domain
MSLDKYRYHIYPDRIYVIEISKGISIELRGSEIISMLGIDSYFD